MTSRHYHICKDEKDGVVSICYGGDACDYFDGFINIWVDDDMGEISSPFSNIEDAETFARIIVKLLKSIEKVVE